MAREARPGKRVLFLDEGGNWKGCGTAWKLAAHRADATLAFRSRGEPKAPESGEILCRFDARSPQCGHRDGLGDLTSPHGVLALREGLVTSACGLVRVANQR